MSVRKGDTAPAFELPEKPGQTVDLASVIGREPVVLLFFPLAFSPVCTDEMCAFRDDWQRWEQLGAKVFGVSVDSPFVTAKFREETNIPFPVLSDFNKDVARQYDVLHEDFKGLKGIAKRSAFVIGPDGSVVYDWVSEDPTVQVDFEAIASAVTATGAATG